VSAVAESFRQGSETNLEEFGKLGKLLLAGCDRRDRHVVVVNVHGVHLEVIHEAQEDLSHTTILIGPRRQFRLELTKQLLIAAHYRCHHIISNAPIYCDQPTSRREASYRYSRLARRRCECRLRARVLGSGSATETPTLTLNQPHSHPTNEREREERSTTHIPQSTFEVLVRSFVRCSPSLQR